MCRRFPGSGQTRQHPCVSALGWCPGAVLSFPGLWLLGVGRAEGGFFLAGIKINLLSVQQLTLGLDARNVCSAARDSAVATATAERGDTLPLPPSAPPK